LISLALKINLSKLKALIILLENYNIEKKDDQLIWVILSKLGSAYSIFVYTFHSTREVLGATYTPPDLESFCDSLIREKDKILHLGVINTIGTSNKALMAQQKCNPSIQRSNILATISKARITNPLNQVQLPMVTNEQN